MEPGKNILNRTLDELRKRVTLMPPEPVIDQWSEPTRSERCLSSQQSYHVPPEYLGALVTDFTPSDFDARCDSSWLFADPFPHARSVFIAGPNGTGKTRLAAALVGEWGGCWRTAQEIMDQVHATWRRGADETEAMVTGDYKKRGILVIDDITAIERTERGLSVILAIIGVRVNYLRPTIVTSYQGIASIDRIDSSLASRLGGFSQIRTVGKDKRISGF